MANAVSGPARVLPTLRPDGSRNRVRPKLFKGRFFRARRCVAYALLGAFVLIPFVELGGKPLILLDLVDGQFTFFGATLLATDVVLVMLAVLAVFLGIFLVSALLGRVWCGWACPQTVYMEFVFRPLERLFEGGRRAQLELDRRGGGLRRLLKNVAFFALSLGLGNVFVAYFVGAERLVAWMQGPPAAHPVAFAAMAITAGLVFVDFAYFREQMCSVACPYARLQSVLLDTRSLIVGYDAPRGEPRRHGSARAGGDCVDCNNCVVACPTGIDIRQGLQLDCIACAQCIDACDWVMARLKKPGGLVRYGAAASLASGQPTRVLRPRIVVYSLLLGATLVALLLFGLARRSADVTILRGIGAPYVVDGDTVRNHFRVKIENHGSADREYTIEIEAAAGASLIVPENPLVVPPGRHQTSTAFVVAPRALFSQGPLPVKIRVRDGADFDRVFEHRLIGPRTGAP